MTAEQEKGSKDKPASDQKLGDFTHRTAATSRKPAKQPRVPRTFVVKKRYSKYAGDLMEKGGRPLPMRAWVQEKATNDSANKGWGRWLAAK